MGNSIQVNMSALKTARLIGESSRTVASTMYQTSSGLRVARAQDDAAAMAIGSALKAEVLGLGKAVINIQSADAMLQTAESAMAKVNQIIIRMKELAIQSLSEQLSTSDLDNLDAEYQELLLEVDRIGDSTKYNGKVLLDGSQVAGINIQIGTTSAATDSINVTISDCKTTALTINGTNINTDRASTQGALTSLIQAEGTVNTARAKVGASQSRMQFALDVVSVARENSEQARSALMDLNIPEAMANLAVQTIREQAGYEMLSRANQGPQNMLGILRG